MSESRKKPGWPFWASVASIVVLIGYPASLMPIDWAHRMGLLSQSHVNAMVRPAFSEVSLSIYGITFAAFCVSLTARLVNRRERWAKWSLATVIGLPILYFGSLGPFTGLSTRGLLPKWSWQFVDSYLAPRQLALSCSQIFGNVYIWYVGFWTADPPSGNR